MSWCDGLSGIFSVWPPSYGWERPKQAGWEFRVIGPGLRVQRTLNPLKVADWVERQRGWELSANACARVIGEGERESRLDSPPDNARARLTIHALNPKILNSSEESGRMPPFLLGCPSGH